jgi:hypothetical protein
VERRTCLNDGAEVDLEAELASEPTDALSPTGKSRACKTLVSGWESSDVGACWVSFMVKLLRAYGGCLGANRR